MEKNKAYSEAAKKEIEKLDKATELKKKPRLSKQKRKI